MAEAQGGGNSEPSERFLTASANEQRSAWTPYRSIASSYPQLKGDDQSSSALRSSNCLTPQKKRKLNPEAAPFVVLTFSGPPWRSRLGTAYLGADSNLTSTVEASPEKEQDELVRILRQTYMSFSDVPIGSDIPIETSMHDAVIRDGTTDGWTTDNRPVWGSVGDQGILYDTLHVGPPEETDLVQARRPEHLCWNCRQPGHILANCPQPRNTAQIDASRQQFFVEKDAIPAAHMDVYLDRAVNAAEKERRLHLLDLYRPGYVSEALQEALFFVDQEDPPDADELQRVHLLRSRRRWPWLHWMTKWGYPPGWIATGDPISEARRRIQLEPETEEGPDPFWTEDDMLRVYADAAPSAAKLTKAANGAENEALDDQWAALPFHPPLPSSAPPPSPPPLPDEQPPPSPPHHPPAPWWTHPPLQRDRDHWLPKRRWAQYDTELFDSGRLVAYTSARPLPLGW